MAVPAFAERSTRAILPSVGGPGGIGVTVAVVLDQKGMGFVGLAVDHLVSGRLWDEKDQDHDEQTRVRLQDERDLHERFELM